MNPDLSLALRRSAEHAASIRQMLFGIPSGTKLHPSCPHTVGDLSEHAAGLSARLAEAVRLADEGGAGLRELLLMLGEG